MDFGEIRSLANSLKGIERWNALVKLLDRTEGSDDEMVNVVIPYLEGILKREKYRRDAPEEWFKNGKFHPAFCLANFSRPNIGPVEFESFSNSENTRNLIGLAIDPRMSKSFSAHLNDDSFTKVIRSPYMENLKWLECPNNRLVSIDFKGMSTQGLEYLNLSKNLINDDSIVSMASSPAMRSLKTLVISNNKELRPKALKAICESPYLVNLEHLDIRSVNFDPPSFLPLLSTSSTLINLKSLLLSPYEAGWSVIDLIIKSPHLHEDIKQFYLNVVKGHEKDVWRNS